MAQQRAWIATGLEPPPPDFMPYGTASIPAASIPGAVTNEETTILTTNETTQNDGGQRTQTEDGLEGAEAKLAADGLMSAALAMAGAGAHRGGGRAKKSTAEVRKEEERVALERAALEAGEELSDDDVDDGMDDLDDVDLVSPGWRNGSSASNSKFASSRPGPGLNVGLNVKGVGGYVTGVSSPGPLAAPRRMGGPSQFDDASAPASAAEVRAGIGVRGETNPKNPTTNPNPDPRRRWGAGRLVERAKTAKRPIRTSRTSRGARRAQAPRTGGRVQEQTGELGGPGSARSVGLPGG